MNRKLSVEFERRLKKLDCYINQYFETGNYGSLFPCLFSCISYVWSHHDDGRVYAKTSVKK